MSISAVQSISTASPKAGTLRHSSWTLGWRPLNLERRDTQPAVHTFAQGARDHLIFVSLSSGRVRCERGGEATSLRVRPGFVAVQPAGLPVTWHSETPLSFAVLCLEPAFVETVAASSFGLRPEDVKLVAGTRDVDPTVAHIAASLSRELLSGELGGHL